LNMIRNKKDSIR